MRTLSRAVPVAFALALAGLWLIRSGEVHTAADAALRLCVGSLLPTLFPFFVLTGFLISLGFPAALGRLLRRPMQAFFHVGGAGSGALVLGLLGGYPTGARAVAELYTAGELSKDEAERLLAFCCNCGPAFLISYVGGEILRDLRAGVWLWLLHVFSALAVGVLFRGKETAKRRVLPRRRESLPAAFTAAVSGGFSAYLTVCSFVLLFSVAAFPLQYLPAPWSQLRGLFELSGGVSFLTSDGRGFVLASLFAGFGGFAVHMQSLAFILGAGLSPRRYFAGKCVQALLAALLAAAVVPFLF